MPELSLAAWLAGALALFLVGWSKTAVGGVGVLGIVVLVQVLPARQATGTLLPLLVAADVVAVAFYRRHADWSLLWRLFPWVAVGTVLGAWFIGQVEESVLRRTIGVVLLVAIAVQLLTRSRERSAKAVGHPGVAVTVGAAAGFATMVANAAGSVMTLYLLASGLKIMRFLGTAAWFYLLVNSFKMPFAIGLGLVTPRSLLLDLVALPVVVAGALVGRWSIQRIDQALFERLALGLTSVGALLLLR